MSGFFFFVWFVTLIGFIVYWWKKRKARQAGGDDYQNSPEYLKASKIKRIIGAVCVVSLVLGFATSPSKSPEEQAKIESERQAKAEKDAAEKAEKEAKANIEKAANLSGEDKSLFDAKFNEYMGSMDEQAARAKALADVDNAIKARNEAAEAARKEQEAAAAAAQKAEKERSKLADELASGWDTENLKDSQKNFEKAVRFVGAHSDYIQAANPEYPNLEAALKKPWDYYGKVVVISGPVGTVTQEPPGHSVSKIFGGNCFHTVIQGDFPVSIIIKGVSDNIRDGQVVRVKGLIIGQTDLQNMMGGSPVGLEFVGILDQ